MSSILREKNRDSHFSENRAALLTKEFKWDSVTYAEEHAILLRRYTVSTERNYTNGGLSTLILH